MYILLPEYILFLALVENGYTIFEYTDFVADVFINTRIDDTIYRVSSEVGLSFDFHF